MEMENSEKHKVWEVVSIEVEGPFTASYSHSQYVVILTDFSSKWIEAKALTDKSPFSIASFVTATFARMGFCDCHFVNIEPNFEREIRASIFAQGSFFVQNLEKSQSVLARICNGDLTADGKEHESITAADLKSVTRGYHTEKLLQWIKENEQLWDIELERHLFQLRTEALDDGDETPFSIVHGGRRSMVTEEATAAKDGAEKKKTVHSRRRYGRRRPLAIRRKPKDSGSEATESLQSAGTEQPNEASGSCAKTATHVELSGSPAKKFRGRPRKNRGTFVGFDEKDGKSGSSSVEVVEGTRRYGLRTTLKAKVKTNIVQRMLRLSTRKRIMCDENRGHAYALTPTATVNSKIRKVSKTVCKRLVESNVVNALDENEVPSDSKTKSSYFKKEMVTRCRRLSQSEFDKTGVRACKDIEANVTNERIGDDDVDDDDDVVSGDISDYGDDDDVENLSNDASSEDREEIQTIVSCADCPGSLFTQQELELHKNFHKEGSKLLHCYCLFVTSTWKHMQDHLYQHIDNKISAASATIKKLKGSRVVSAVASRKLRRKELLGVTPTQCSVCVTHKMATEAELQFHLLCHKDESKLLHCPYCSVACGAWQQMVEHLQAHPEVPVEVYASPIEERTCPRCKKAFPRSEMVLQHQLIYHAKDRRYQCEMCGKTFKERKSIMRHQEIHANIVYQCSNCNYKTKIQKDFLEHQRIHQGTGYICNICSKVFARQSQLTLHLECHRKDRGVAICDQCGHQANGLIALRHHLRNVHGNPQAWPCSMCSYIGRTKSNLKGHTDRIHNKKYKCPHCDFACLAECTLEKHVDIFHNEGERRFPCPHCPYRAREPKCLTEHVRVLHNPYARKYPCEFCGTEFKTKSMLRDHMPQHTGQRFVCQLCGYVAKYRSILYRHVKKRHPEEKLSTVMKATEPLVIETPNGKPIMPPKSRVSRRRLAVAEVSSSLQSAHDMVNAISVGTEVSESALAFVTSDLAELTADGDVEAGGMYIATSEDGEPVALNHNSIVLDASILAQAAAGRTIALPNNLCLQIIHKDQNGENITMQVIPGHVNDGDDKAVELLLLAGDIPQENIADLMADDGDVEPPSLVMQ